MLNLDTIGILALLVLGPAIFVISKWVGVRATQFIDSVIDAAIERIDDE